MPKSTMAAHVTPPHGVPDRAARTTPSSSRPLGFTTVLAAMRTALPTTPAPRIGISVPQPVATVRPSGILATAMLDLAGVAPAADHAPPGRVGGLRRSPAEPASGPAKAVSQDAIELAGTGHLEPPPTDGKPSSILSCGLFGPMSVVSMQAAASGDAVKSTASQPEDIADVRLADSSAIGRPAPTSTQAEPRTTPEHRAGGPFAPATLGQADTGLASSPTSPSVAPPNQGSTSVEQPNLLQPTQNIVSPAGSPPSGPAPSVIADPGAQPGAATQVGQAAIALHLGSGGGAPGGASQITIHLQPGDLGAVEIHIERAHDGSATVVLAVEKADTLHVLQQDVQHLHQALDRAGLPVEARHVSFHLAEPSGSGSLGFQAGNGGQGAGQQGSPPRPRSPAGTLAAPHVAADSEPLGSGWQAAGINITA